MYHRGLGNSLREGTSRNFKKGTNSLFIYLLAMPRGLRDLSSQPGIEPGPAAVKAQSPKRWTAREFPIVNLITGNFRSRLGGRNCQMSQV